MVSFNESNSGVAQVTTTFIEATEDTSLKGDVTPLKGDVIPLKGDVAHLKGDVTPLKSDVTPLTGDVTPLKGYVTPQKSDVNPLKVTPSSEVTLSEREVFPCTISSTQPKSIVVTFKSNNKQDSPPPENEITPLQGEVTPLEGKTTPLQGKVTPSNANTTPKRRDTTQKVPHPKRVARLGSRKAHQNEWRRRAEDNLAIVFMGFILVFLCCHLLRIVIDCHELLTLEEANACRNSGVSGVPAWSSLVINVSHVMLTVNSAINILIYCGLSSKFREEFGKVFSWNKNDSVE